MTQRRWLWWPVAGLVLLALTWVTLGHQGAVPEGQRLRVTPFEEMFTAVACVLSHCRSASSAFRLVLINGLGNIVAFFPLGAVLYAALVADRLLRTRSIVLATLIGLIVSTTFEIIQIWIPGRVVALDDIILNTGGAIAGAWIAYLMHGHIQVKPRESALLQ